MEIYSFQDIWKIKGELLSSPFIHPTNSCYGIGGNIYSEGLYQQIYFIKGRPQEKPFFITVPDITMWKTLAVWDVRVDEFLWKFPDKIFTFILKRKKELPGYINPNFSSVGIQIASGKLEQLFMHIDFPVFWTSANISAQSPIYDSDSIKTTFWIYDDIIFLDGWNLQESSPSTIIDLRQGEYKILRWNLD